MENISPYRELEDLLKCGICHETMVTPVMTSCSHSYCSLCIRKWLATKTICPTCSLEAYEKALRKNPIVENIIGALERLRSSTGNTAVAVATVNKKLNISSPSTPKPTQKPNLHLSSDEDDSDSFAPKASLSKVVLKTPNNRYQKAALKVTCEDEDEESVDDVGFVGPSSSTFTKYQPATPKFKPKSVAKPTTPQTQSSPAQQKVACPVCSVLYQYSMLNDHLDKCLLTKPNSVDSAIASTSSSSRSHTPTQKVVNTSVSGAGSNQRLQPIKSLVYNLLSDAQLRKELKKYGLSTQGDRGTLRSRLQRYVVMHNAECDATHPRSVEELKKIFDKEEKALMQMQPAAKSLSLLFKSKAPNEEEFETLRHEYLKQNNNSYQSLIDDVKRRAQKKKNMDSSEMKIATNTVLVKDSGDESDEQQLPTSKAESGVQSRKIHVVSDSEDFNEPVNKNGKRRVQSSGESDTETSTKIVKRNVKRKVKYIESESDSDDDDLIKKPMISVPPKACTSPVLSNKTPVRRQLRSRTQQPVPQNKSTMLEKQNTTCRKKEKKEGNTTKKAVKEKQSELPAIMIDECSRESKRITPDLFGSPPSPASSDIPCGQKRSLQPQDLENDSEDALSQLVSLMDKDEDSGSTTDFE